MHGRRVALSGADDDTIDDLGNGSRFRQIDLATRPFANDLPRSHLCGREIHTSIGGGEGGHGKDDEAREIAWVSYYKSVLNFNFDDIIYGIPLGCRVSEWSIIYFMRSYNTER